MAQLGHLGTATEAAGVQEWEDIEAEGPGQHAGGVCSLQGEPSAHTQAHEPQLLHWTAQHKVLQHHPPLAVRPPVKLNIKKIKELRAHTEPNAQKRKTSA